MSKLSKLLNISFGPIDETLSGTIASDPHELGTNGTESELKFPKAPRLVSYKGYLLRVGIPLCNLQPQSTGITSMNTYPLALVKMP